jgi:hypothetical protein
MKTGDIIKIRWPPETSLSEEVTIVDDCFRVTDERCTALVRLNRLPHIELELNIEELTDGKDL